MTRIIGIPINYVKRTRRNLSALQLLIMCELTGVTLRWIIYGEDGEINIQTKQEQELLTNIRAMDDKSRQALLDMARAIPPANKK